MGSKKWFSLVKIVAPMIIGLVKPKLGPIAGDIVDGISEAEEIFEKGSDKLAHVKNIAEKSANVVNGVQGKEVVNKEELSEAVTKAVETIIAVTNMLDKSDKEQPQG